MGKKSKRNRGASKKQQSAGAQQGGVTNTSASSDVAAASTAAAVVGNEIDPRSTSASAGSIRIDPIDSLVQLVEKGDYEGILKLESKLVLLATALEGTEPEKAGYIYLMVANALIATEVSSKISREKTIDYLERCWKAMHSLEIMLHECVRLLVSLYLKEGRHDEAFVTLKRLTVRIPQHELIDPDFILFIAHEFFQATQFESVIVILSMFLGTINRSWDKDERSNAYLSFGEGYTNLAEYEKADSFFQKALAITEDPESKVAVLSQMGAMSRFACNYDDALTALNQALEILSSEKIGERSKSDDSWSKLTASVHLRIGDVLSDWGKRDGEALESFERAIVIMKENHPEDHRYFASMYQGVGLVHARLGNWDEAIDYLNSAHNKIGATNTKSKKIYSRFYAELCEQIGRVRLDQYFWDERLRHDTQEQNSVLTDASIFTTESMVSGLFIKDSILTGAQLAYIFARKEEANKLLLMYFEVEYEMKRGISCRSCNRKAGNGTDIKICRNCQVVDYCSEAHQTLAWRRGRLSHKVMCPFLKRYRLVVKAKNRIDKGEPVEDICKDFFETVCVWKDKVKK
jgi:tetratricopeptide (TPR) repeat protein